MARQRLCEYRAKVLLARTLGQTYHGLQLQADGDWRAQLAGLSTKANSGGRYVAKVDQAVGGRLKQGLVLLDLPPDEVPAAVEKLFARGYHHVLVEPFTPHQASTERYLAMKRQRYGVAIMFSTNGGVDIEAQAGAVPDAELTPSSANAAEQALGLSAGTIGRLHTLFNNAHFAFLEINPLTVSDGQPLALDLVVEVDAEAQNFVSGAWTAADLRHTTTSLEETAVAALAERSPASFSLKSLNPNGQIFAVLVGGGASLVIIDEVCHQGFGPALGNYGEYSGDPSEDETCAYVTQVVHMLLRSKAKNRVLIIGGGVANFTDVRVTFAGTIRALDAQKSKLRAAGVKVYVRRGGPHADDGLTAMSEFLEREHLLGLVAGPELGLADLVSAATANLKPLAL